MCAFMSIVSFCKIYFYVKFDFISEVSLIQINLYSMVTLGQMWLMKYSQIFFYKRIIRKNIKANEQKDCEQGESIVCGVKIFDSDNLIQVRKWNYTFVCKDIMHWKIVEISAIRKQLLARTI